MALTRRGKAAAGPKAAGPKAAGGVRKPAAKVKSKPGAVVTKRIVVRRPGSSKGASTSQAGLEGQPEQGLQPDQEEQHQQHEQREQQPAAAAKRRRTAAAAGGSGEADATIDALSAEALQEVFLHVGQEQQSYCRCGVGDAAELRARSNRVRAAGVGWVLVCRTERPSCTQLQGDPAAGVQALPRCATGAQRRVGGELPAARPAPPCVRSTHQHLESAAPGGDSRLASAAAPPCPAIFRHLPTLPSQSLHMDFIAKGLDLAFPQLQQPDAGDGLLPPDGSNRRLLHSAVERWLKPRAAAVKRLVLS